MMSPSNKILNMVIGSTQGWFAIRQINHMDMGEQLEQIIINSLMENSIKDKDMDILDISTILVTIIIMNIQMVNK